MPRRLTPSLQRGHAMHVTRVSVQKQKLVYVIVADIKLQYEAGRSRIAYIGTTEKGIARISSSVAYRANKILDIHGVREFDVRIVTCPPRQHVKTWRKLERALLLSFREMYGEVPWCNVQGKGVKETDEFRYFTRKKIDRIIEDMG